MRLQRLGPVGREREVVDTGGRRHGVHAASVKLDTLPYDGLENGRAGPGVILSDSFGAVFRSIFKLLRATSTSARPSSAHFLFVHAR